MTKLVKWQFFSMISRFAAMGIGILQSIFVVRYLSTAEYGLVGLVTSLGSVVGILLHLGLVSGTIREIAANEDVREKFQIFVTSFFIRLSVAVLLSLVLFFSAPLVARKFYSHPEIAFPIRIFAVTLFVQSVQGIFDAVLSGFKRFKQLFVFQVAIALVSLALYIPLILKFGFYGYFWAMLGLAIIHSFALFVLAIDCFSKQFGYLAFPLKQFPALVQKLFRNLGWNRLIVYGKRIFSVGFSIYIVKILFTLWEKFGPLALGRVVSASDLGIFNFGLFFATKLMTASDAVTAVNLPVFSESFVDGLEKFRQEFDSNFKKIFAFITFSAATAVFWSPELFYIVVGSKYNATLPLVPWLVVAFWCYSFVNIINSSILIPAKMTRDMIVSYLILLVGTAVSFFVLPDGLYAMAYAMFLGSDLALLWQAFALLRYPGISIFRRETVVLMIISIPLFALYLVFSSLVFKALFFIVIFLAFAYFVDRFGILKFSRVCELINKRL